MIYNGRFIDPYKEMIKYQQLTKFIPMKKRLLNYFVFFVTTVMLLSSCGGLQKMADRANEVEYTLKPNVLEMHAEQVAMKLSVKFPAKYFDKKAILIVTPVLKYDGGEKQYRSFTIQGESVKENNEYRVPYATSKTISVEDTIPYADVMRISELELRITASAGDKKINFISPIIGKGVITTPRLVAYGMFIDSENAGGSTIMATVQLPEQSTAQSSVQLFYALQKSNLSRTEMRKSEIVKILAEIKANSEGGENEISGLVISSYASPDGPLAMNQKLVTNRGAAAKKFIEKELKKAKVAKLDDANFITTATTADEDWEGFKALVQASELEEKDLILRVLSMYQDPEVREREIKNIAEAYSSLKNDILPMLRRSVLKVNFKSATKSNDELLTLATSNPATLSNLELMHAATLTEDLDKKVAIYLQAIAKESTDWKAYNNLACVYISQKNLAEAKVNLNKANQLNDANGMVLNNLGVLALADGNTDEAVRYFNEAKAAGCTSNAVNYNLAVLQLKNAEYNDAVSTFGADASFNKALAQLLAGNSAAAESTMNTLGDSKHGAFYYLKAIIAARQNKQADVLVFLKKAVELDASFKAYADADREFLKVAGSDEFNALIK